LNGGYGDPKEVFDRRGIYAQKPCNLFMQGAMPAGTIFQVTDGMCSCGFASPLMPPFDEDGERAAYLAKGWSGAKIARALEGKRAAYERRRSTQTNLRFHESLAELCTCGWQIVLLCHMFSGWFGAPVIVAASTLMTLREMAERGFPDDTLITVYKGSLS